MLVRRAPQGPGVRIGAGGTSYGTTSEVDFVPPSEVDLMDVSPKQIVSISTALIPFIEHDDANRALMGANMQKQAVPLVRPEAPFIGTGVEARAARDAGDVLVAEGNGHVVDVSGDHVTVEYEPGQQDWAGTTLGRKVYRLAKFRRSNQNTCLNQRLLVEDGARIVKGDVLADGPSTEAGELALGKNLLVAFMPWEGYNYEDAIILSERLVARRRAHLDPHRGARGRRPGHQARGGGDHPGHPQPLRGDPEGPRRARDHPHRGRGRSRRRPRRQGHPQGRDRADPGGAPAPGDLR